MICPNRQCEKEIPEDSLYCDICGKALKKCPKCGKLSTSNFCTSDGSPTGALVSINGTTSPGGVAPGTKPGPPNETVRDVQGKTPMELVLVHTGGEALKITTGSIVGRKEGPLSSYLGRFGTISGKHGEVKLREGKWVFCDLGSTNGSRLNGKQCISNQEYELHKGDILELADQKFQVG